MKPVEVTSSVNIAGITMGSETGDLGADAEEVICKLLFGGMKDSSASWFVAKCTKRVGGSQKTSSHSLHLLLSMSTYSKFIVPRSSLKWK